MRVYVLLGVVLISMTATMATAQEGGGVIYDLLAGLLGSSEIMGPLIVFLLSLIPGPFRGIAKALVSWLLERARNELERRKGAVSDRAVLAVEQLKKTGRIKTGQDALNAATNEIVKTLDVDMGEAKRLAEASVGKMNALTHEEKEIAARLDELEKSLTSGY